MIPEASENASDRKEPTIHANAGRADGDVVGAEGPAGVRRHVVVWFGAAAAVAFLLFNQCQVADLRGPEDWFMPRLAIWAAPLFGLVSARKGHQ